MENLDPPDLDNVPLASRLQLDRLGTINQLFLMNIQYTQHRVTVYSSKTLIVRGGQ
jgi:hypothetical protein